MRDYQLEQVRLERLAVRGRLSRELVTHVLGHLSDLQSNHACILHAPVRDLLGSLLITQWGLLVPLRGFDATYRPH